MTCLVSESFLGSLKYPNENFFQKAYNNFRYLDEYRVVELHTGVNIKSSNDADLIISDLIIASDEIKFTTNKPNEAHIIKISY